MSDVTLNEKAVRRLYDRIGSRYDWLEFYESKAKRKAVWLLDPLPGDVVLNAGCGTGKNLRPLATSVSPGGMVIGLDISLVMARLATLRSTAAVCQASVRALPFSSDSIDRVYAAYLLDLIPAANLSAVLAELRRIIRPGGRLVLITLTEGANLASRLLVMGWKTLYAISPVACGGCRPLQLAPLVRAAGFQHVTSSVVIQFAVPSEIVSGVA